MTGCLRVNSDNLLLSMKIDHICFAVKNLREGILYWNNVFGYKQMTGIVTNTRQKVKVTFLCKEDSITIKLIEPLESNISLVNFVNRGGGFHHLCFKCDDLDDQLADLNKKGLLTLVPPQEGEAFNNNKIAFLLAKYALNIELIDTDEKAEMI
jgi:methylmalonyl-CoA/ethylmalonyl-CoA epimerase